jgi:hypothetical protein
VTGAYGSGPLEFAHLLGRQIEVTAETVSPLPLAFASLARPHLKMGAGFFFQKGGSGWQTRQ